MNDAWTDWQREHAAALAALQDAQRAYHRIAVASPQSTVGSRPSAVDSREGALEALDAARVRLDDVRARMPR